MCSKSTTAIFTLMYCNHLRDAGIALWAWPTTVEEEIIPAIKTGADGVMGDDPTLAVKLVNQLCPSA